MDDNALAAFSKGLSSLLRHNQGGLLDIARDGFADVDAVVAAVNATRRPKNLGVEFDAAGLAEVVARDGKGRFDISPDGSRVRAVSGHSFEVDLPLESYAPTGPLWFGTVLDKADQIEAEGLTGSLKLKVRLSDSREHAEGIAASRGCLGPVVFEVDARRLAADGFEFGRALNGEILVDRFGADYLVRCEPVPAPR